jgi:hypothetical protein
MKPVSCISARRAAFAALLVVTVCSTAYASVAIASMTDDQGPGDPTVFLQEVIGQLVASDYRKAWQSLDPGQQQLVPAEQYVRCESASPIPGRLTSIEITDLSEQRIPVAGTRTPVPAQAVTFRIQITEPSLHTSVVITHTVHAVQIDDHWAWILPAARLQLDRSPTCGVAEPPNST